MSSSPERPKLTDRMREILAAAAHQELRRDRDLPGASWPAHPLTLAALVRHGLLEPSMRRSKRGHRLDVWAITERGRQALAPRERFRREPAIYLASGRGDFTTWRHAAVDDAEVIDPATLDDAWARMAEQRRGAAEDRRARARRAARNLRASLA